jgi:Ca2+/H+ antiporter, TMEM165/GDT1 family
MGKQTTIADNEEKMKLTETAVSLSPPLPNTVEDTVHSRIASSPATESPAVVPEATSPATEGWDFRCFAGAFGSTFLTVFLAELGDKTQLTTLLMSAESHSPWTVFLGASCALILTSLLGVLVGQWLASKVSPQMLQKASGVCLLMISVGLLWDAFGH